jgi:hypothetical protein
MLFYFDCESGFTRWLHIRSPVGVSGRATNGTLAGPSSSPAAQAFSNDEPAAASFGA